MKTEELRKLNEHIRVFSELARTFPRNHAYAQRLARLEASRDEVVSQIEKHAREDHQRRPNWR